MRPELPNQALKKLQEDPISAHFVPVDGGRKVQLDIEFYLALICDLAYAEGYLESLRKHSGKKD